MIDYHEKLQICLYHGFQANLWLSFKDLEDISHDKEGSFPSLFVRPALQHIFISYIMTVRQELTSLPAAISSFLVILSDPFSVFAAFNALDPFTVSQIPVDRSVEAPVEIHAPGPFKLIF